MKFKKWAFYLGMFFCQSGFAFEIMHDLSFNEERIFKNLISTYNLENKTNIQLKRIQSPNDVGVLNVLSAPDAVFLNPKKYQALYKMMAAAKKPLSIKLLPFLKHGNLDKRGNVVALPLFYSTPVLFLNKESFLKAKLKNFQAPQTWQDLQELLGLLQDSGVRCPYTSTWPAWIHLDNTSTLLGESTMDARGQLRINTLNQLRHIALMRTWQQAEFYWSYGAGNDALREFYNGKCAVLSSDASAYGTLKNSHVALDFLPLPHHKNNMRGFTLAHGAALWAGAAKSKKDLSAAAAFVHYLTLPQTQVFLTQNAATLPFTESGKQLALKELPVSDKTLLQMELKHLKAASTLRLGKITALRQIMDEELFAIWQGKKTAKAGLDSAVQRGNALLRNKAAFKKEQPF